MNRDFCDVDVRQLRAEIERGALLVDVRTFAEYSANRIEGARLIPLDQIEQRSAEIDRKTPVYLICRTGRRSAEAQHRLLALGFENVFNIAGGMTAWVEEGYPIVHDAGVPWSIERQTRVVAGTLVIVGAILGYFVAVPLVWFSAVIGAGLVIAGVTDSCAMGDLLAKLPWNRAVACSFEARKVSL